MKKIIAVMLCLIFSFGIFSTLRQKKVEALATTIVAGYTIAEILGYLALSATVSAAGYYVADNLVRPDDNSDFTDFLQQVFDQTLEMSKHEIPPTPEPLGTLEQATLLSMLTKQGIEVGEDLYNKLYDYFIGADSSTSIPTDYNGDPIFGGYLFAYDSTERVILNGTDFYVNNGVIKSHNPVIKYYSYLGRAWEKYTYASDMPLSKLAYTYDGNQVIYDSWQMLNIWVNSPTDISTEIEPPIEVPDIVVKPLDMPSYGELLNAPFKGIDMTPLNGLVSSPEELTDIINGNKVVSDYQYGKITEAFNDIYDNFLENPNYSGAGAPILPSIDPETGTQYYGNPKLDEPIVQSPPETPDTELGFWAKILYWLKAIWQVIRDLPSKIFQPIVTAINNIVQPILDGIEKISLGLYDLLADLFKFLFVPDDDFFTNKINDIDELIDIKLPLIGNIQLITSSIIDSFQIGMNGTQPEFKITLPIKYGGTTHKIIDFTFYNDYRFLINSFIIMISYYFFIRRMMKRIPKIIYI